jgi:hypothetical protein
MRTVLFGLWKPAVSVLQGAGFTWFCCVLMAGCGGKPADSQNAKQAETSPKTAQGIFEGATQKAGIDFSHQLVGGKIDNIMKSNGSGGAFLDFDGDGFMDIYLVNAGPAPVLADAPAGTKRLPNRLYRNRGDGSFDDVTVRAGVEAAGFGTTAAAADYDNDGRTDLLVVNFGSLILYHNQGDGTFKDVTSRAGLASKGAGISATFFDYDGDGFLDLFVVNYLVFDPAVKPPKGAQVPYPGPLSYEAEFNILYRNRRDGTFEDVSQQTGIRIAGHRGMSVTAFDYDLDGNPDLYVSNDGTPNLLLANDGKGQFKEVAMQAGAAFDQAGVAAGSMGTAVGDCNGDGWPDMLVTRFGNASLYVNSPAHLFEDRITPSGILNLSSQFVGWGGNFIDFDNDGDLDVFMANGSPHYLTNGMPSLLLENDGTGRFTNARDKGGPFFHRLLNLRGSGVFDMDNDGRPDLLACSMGGRPVLLHNRGSSDNHWITLKLVGTRCNRDGFGAQVKVSAGGKVWQAEARCPTAYLFQQDPRLHFGLGHSSKADRIEIQWPKPGGQRQVLENIAADQILRVQQP